MSDDQDIHDTFTVPYTGRQVIAGQEVSEPVWQRLTDELSANERMTRRLQDAWDIVEGVALRDPFIALTVGVKWCMYCGNSEDEHDQRGDCLWIDAKRIYSGYSRRGSSPERTES